MESFFLPILFFAAALIYSSAGFGGGSTYLALLVLFSFPDAAIVKTALLCNIVVVLGGWYLFAKEGYFCIGKIWPFVAASVPFAYLGGRIPIGKDLFLILLGISLAAAGLQLFFSGPLAVAQEREKHFSRKALPFFAGAVLGLVSGMTGIGGGVFLAPLLYFLRWGGAKEIAAASAFFILLNSVAGFLGQLAKDGDLLETASAFPLIAAVFAGGQIGARLGAQKIPPLKLQKITASLILYVSARIFWRFL